MNIIPLEFSIVIVGEDCNPTILNPDFLKYRNIVPEDWNWSFDGAPITTPAFAMVAYDSGVTIRVEPNRVQMTDSRSVEHVAESPVLTVAKKYIETIPHVRYTAVGLNFRRIVEMENPEGFLKDRFLKSGPWSQNGESPQSLGLRLFYPYESGQMTFSMEPAVVERRQLDRREQVRGVMVHANYHRDCGEYPADRIAQEYIDRAPADEEHLVRIFGLLLTDTVQPPQSTGNS